jgi:hypothetical protein
VTFFSPLAFALFYSAANKQKVGAKTSIQIVSSVTFFPLAIAFFYSAVIKIVEF